MVAGSHRICFFTSDPHKRAFCNFLQACGHGQLWGQALELLQAWRSAVGEATSFSHIRNGACQETSRHSMQPDLVLLNAVAAAVARGHAMLR